MKLNELPIDVHLHHPSVHRDKRGSFHRLADISYLPSGERIAQSSMSFNTEKYTLRGLHFQTPPYQEIKIVTCIKGEIFDVIVDCRPESTTFLDWFSVFLKPDGPSVIVIPKGYAHGFLTLLDDTIVSYAMTAPFNNQAYSGYRYSDPKIGISWPALPRVISDKDLKYDLLE